MTYQYRITVNGSIGPVLTTYPGEHWSHVATCSEDRGLTATLERRLVTDTSILELLTDATGYLKLGNTVLCPWETQGAML